MIALDLRRPPHRPLEVLCLGAHADDIEIGCGGTLLRLVAEGSARIRWVVFSATPERAAEAEASARVFGVGAEELSVTVHGFRDGHFPMQRGAIKEAVAALREAGDPDVVFTHDEADLHQDHRILGALARETFRDHLILGYEIPKWDGGLATPGVYVPLDEDVARRKVRAVLEAFPSQRSKHWFDEETLMGLLRLRGLECAAPGRYAEGFHAAKVRLLG